MAVGDVVDKLHDKHGLAHASTTKQTNLTTLREWLNKVDNLDTSIENLLRY